MAKYTQNDAKNGCPGEYPGFLLSKCEQMRKKMRISRLLDPCIMSCECRAVHMSRLLHTQVLYLKCRNKAPPQAWSL